MDYGLDLCLDIFSKTSIVIIVTKLAYLRAWERRVMLWLGGSATP